MLKFILSFVFVNVGNDGNDGNDGVNNGGTNNGSVEFNERKDNERFKFEVIGLFRLNTDKNGKGSLLLLLLLLTLSFNVGADIDEVIGIDIGWILDCSEEVVVDNGEKSGGIVDSVFVKVEEIGWIEGIVGIVVEEVTIGPFECIVIEGTAEIVLICAVGSKFDDEEVLIRFESLLLFSKLANVGNKVLLSSVLLLVLAGNDVVELLL